MLEALLRRKRELARNSERVTELVCMKRETPNGISHQDYIDAAAAINVPAPYLKAFATVESRDAGFDQHGRLTILYEPHRVHIATKGVLTGMKFQWSFKGRSLQIPLSYRGWKPRSRPIVTRPVRWHPYFEDPEGQWNMLATAYELHPEVLRGVSWGAFQILGKWAERLGYRDPLDMIRFMYKGEIHHLSVALRYLKMTSPQAIPALRAGDFRTVARLYNGKGQVDDYTRRFKTAVRRAQREFARV